ncbi:MAG TPA: helical backbone metal receptor [Gemmatimonadaceae bacterium]
MSHSQSTRFAGLVTLAAALAVAGCAPREEPPRAVTDTAAPRPPVDDFRHEAPRGEARRIVSLNPATTELLVALGAAGRLVGRTSWDLYTPAVRRARDLGNGIRPNVEAVLEMRPDLVILYGSEDNVMAARRLREAGVPTLSLKLDRIGQLERAAMLVGAAVGEEDRARTVVDSVHQTLDSVRAAVAGRERPRAFWHVWDSPIITIGRGSFLHELVEIAGGENVYADIPSPSPRVELEDIARRDPAVILAGPVGARRIREEQRWRAVRAVRNGRVLVVDTNLVARPSVRLGEAAVSLARLLHPGSL